MGRNPTLNVGDPTLNVRNPTLNAKNGTLNVNNPHREGQRSSANVGNPIAIIATPTECVRATANVGPNPDMMGLRLSQKSPDTEKNAGETFLIRPGQRYTRHLIAGCPGS